MSTADLVLSEDQQRALDRIEEFVKGSIPEHQTEISLGGLAGTGKTTLVSLLLARGPTVLAPTAKACAVLRRKGVPARTIHSAIYDFAGVDSSGARPVLTFDENGSSYGGLLIVDEASMVTRPVADDLRRAAYRLGGKILWVGDHGQLPPVGEDPKILASPDLRLEKIHRQAESSPILRVAHAVRGGQRLIDAAAHHAADGHVRAVHCPTMLHLEELVATEQPDAILVARNNTRRELNRVGWRLDAERKCGRGVMERDDYPEPFVGAQLIALRNAHKLGIVNGEQYELRGFDPHDFLDDSGEFAQVTLRDYLGGMTECTAWTPALGEGTDRQLAEVSGVDYEVVVLDFAYAITVHRAQGSEWPHVLVVDEAGRSDGNWDSARWAYTAATRAKERLTVVRLGR